MPAGELDAVVTSPPWERQESANAARKHANPEAVAEKRARGYATGAVRGHGASKKAILAQMERENSYGYSDSERQIGNSAGTTYWQAVAEVYAQCALALKPGGIMAVVIKDYVKKGARVPLCDQTLELLVRLGFVPVVRMRAWLVQEQRDAGLFGAIVKKTERKSFFRMLAERKGSPRIDFEEVLVVRRRKHDE